MENPKTWGQAECVVWEAQAEAWRKDAQGYVGLSHTRQITDALRAAGLLKEGE